MARLLADLRGALETAGVTAEVAAEVLDQKAFDLLETDQPGAEARGKVRPFCRDRHSPVQDSRIP